MTTRRATPTAARRFRPLLLLVVGVLAMLAVGSGILAGATDPPCKDAARPQADAGVISAHARPAAPPAADAPTGLDLEVRIWNLRIEFPWLKSLPLRPGRHIVVSIFETAKS